ncbi:MAG TPA: trypsin-like peptidase domain-containing protein, partial [Actinomycetota bacterium]|nr:trypsin-like peptidase domain-containing protein [Actinomycetota bacterium]
MGVLEEIAAAVRNVTERSGGSVVGIGDRFGLGSGVVVAEGRVVTNAHNVRSEEVSVTFSTGRKTTGRVAGLDQEGDLAVVAVDTADAAPLAFAEPTSLSVGLPVFGASNPGGRGLRVT